jgi:hypothetical protein
MLKHKNANRRRQIALLPLSVDCTDQIRDCHALGTGDVFEATPESIFKANAGFASIELDGTLNHG